MGEVDDGDDDEDDDDEEEDEAPKDRKILKAAGKKGKGGFAAGEWASEYVWKFPDHVHSQW